MSSRMRTLCKYFCDVESQSTGAASYSQAAKDHHPICGRKPMCAVGNIPAIGAGPGYFCATSVGDLREATRRPFAGLGHS